jgi:hypothetical protein
MLRWGPEPDQANGYRGLGLDFTCMLPRGTGLPFKMVNVRLPESPARAKGRSGESHSTCKMNARVSSRSSGNEQSDEAEDEEEVDDIDEVDEDVDSVGAKG